jgi:diadenosine tetraphosphate (Ap4A) HIT family hydrolase
MLGGSGMRIHETDNFEVIAHEQPEVDREDGGHIVIQPKKMVSDRTELTPKLAIEMMRLSMLAGEALKLGMARRGVEIGRVNYQENGNWKPQLHLHLYGRAENAKWQKYGEPIKPGHRDEYRALDEADVAEIQSEVTKLEQARKYSMENWGLA